ncbi:MAG TPA: pitrilysin family protein [Bacteroidales bacterium]|nr:pitrilysin family protein [Bacteroidales bacterium]
MDDLRKMQPPVFPVEKPQMPGISQFFLDNSVPVYILEAGTEDVIRIEFVFNAGQIKEFAPLVASTTNMMLKEGTTIHSSTEINRLLDYYGMFLHQSVDKDKAGIVIFGLSRHIDKILEISAELLFHPTFPEKELNALMKKRLQWFLINREKVQNIAFDRLFECMFGKRHPYGRQIVESDYTSLCPSLLYDFHSTNYSIEKMAIIIAGKIPENTISKINGYFGNVNTPEKDKRGNKTTLKGLRDKKVYIEKPGAVQTAIRIGSATINKRHPDYTGLKVVDCILGGYFGSRLMRNIREEKGYTYGVRSGLTSLDLSGYLVISTEVGNEYLNPALDEIYREIRILQEETIGHEELEIVRNYMSGEILRMFDGPFAIAETFKSAWEFGLDFSYYNKLSEKIRNINPDEIKHLVKTYYNIDNLYQVTAGSK